MGRGFMAMMSAMAEDERKRGSASPRASGRANWPGYAPSSRSTISRLAL